MTEISDFDMMDTPQRRRYSKTMPDGEDAELTFLKTAPTRWIADHTFVPEAFRGKDIARKMVERLVQDARKEGATISATCPYVINEFKRHGAEWDDVKA